MSKDTGGPAFPTENGRQVGHDAYLYEGMTLRDYFAAKAMAGLMTRVWNADGKMTGNEVINLWARTAYACADALLEARK